MTSVDTDKTVTVFQADAADSGTGEVDKFAYAMTASVDLNSLKFLPISGSVAAQKYVNVKVSSTSGTEPNIVVLGVEG